MNIYSHSDLSRKGREHAQTIVTRRHRTEGFSIAWTDGACFPNPGLGGWGVRIEHHDGAIAERRGGERQTSNNRMELEAIIQAVAVAGDTPLIVRTDSQLCVLCAVGRWRRKANVDMWLRLAHVVDTRKAPLLFEWWRGHVGEPGNERADQLAGIGRNELVRGGNRLWAHETDVDPDAMSMLRDIAKYG